MRAQTLWLDLLWRHSLTMAALTRHGYRYPLWRQGILRARVRRVALARGTVRPGARGERRHERALNPNPNPNPNPALTLALALILTLAPALTRHERARAARLERDRPHGHG